MPIETFLRLPKVKKNMILRNCLSEFSKKSYQDANTDDIICACNISKGSLYHYFGSKKQLYLYLLSHCLASFERVNGEEIVGKDFYELLFASIARKLRFAITNPMETDFLAMAAKEESGEVVQEKNRLLLTSMKEAEAKAQDLVRRAMEYLPLKNSADPETVLRGLTLYISGLRGEIMQRYHKTPGVFFVAGARIKTDLKRDLDMFLYGICEETEK